MVELIISGLAKAVALAMEAAVNFLLPIFGFNFETFVTAFPFAATAYKIFQSIALGIVLLLSAAQLLPFFFNSAKNRTTPLRIAFGAILAVGAIYYGNYILEGIMQIAEMPYKAMMAADISATAQFSTSWMSVISEVVSAVSILLYIFLLIMIGFSYLKLLLEAVERYVILFVLLYLSPLPASTLASEETSGIFKRFLSMFIAQCILLVLNVWSLQMVNSLFASVAKVGNDQKIICLIVGYAFIRIASRLDSYMNSLGLNAAITGSGLGAELAATGMSLLSKFSPRGGKGFAGDQKGNSSGILGLSRGLSGFVQKHSPVAGLGVMGKNAAGAAGKTAVQGIAAAKNAQHAGQSGIAAFGKAVKDNIGDNMHDAWLSTQGQNNAAKFIGGAHAGVSSRFQTGSEGTITEQNKNDIARHAHLAGTAMASIGEGATFQDPSIVGSVMQGIGIDGLDGGSELIGVATGAALAENLNTTLTDTGIHASYQIDGKQHDWDIKNYSQHNVLSASEQAGYTAFKSADGATYYARHSEERLLSPAQQKDIDIGNAISRFCADPVGNPLSAEQISYIGAHKDSYNSLMDQMAAQGTSVPYTKETADMCANLFEMNAAATRPSNVSRKVLAEARNAIADFESGDVKQFSFSGRGMFTSFNENNRGKTINFLTEHGAADYQNADGSPDHSRLRNRGYVFNDVNGQKHMTHFSEGEAFADDAAARMRNQEI